MEPGSEPDDPLSHKELSELLAAATDTTAAEIERRAEGIDIKPPEQADVVSE